MTIAGVRMWPGQVRTGSVTPPDSAAFPPGFPLSLSKTCTKLVLVSVCSLPRVTQPNQLQVDQLLLDVHIGKQTITITHALLLVESHSDWFALKPFGGRSSGLPVEALAPLGCVDADESDLFGPPVNADKDGVAVQDVGHPAGLAWP